MSSDSHISAASTNSLSSPPVLHLAEFLGSVPSPLTVTLVHLSKPISRIRHVAEITSWQSPWEESWLVLAAWWGVCLLANIGIRYALPLVVLSILALDKRKTRTSNSPPPVTETTLQKTLADLEKIRVLVPAPHDLSTPPITILLRVSAILYVPYLLLTYFVRIRVLVALAGTVVFTWRAPWAHTIRQNLWRSAWVRWSSYRLWSLLSGLPLPQPIRQNVNQFVAESIVQPKSKTDVQTTPTLLRFLFTVHENQRWWMGLDWTAALLPQERPAWSSGSSEQPVTPPSVFTLPPSTTVYLKHDRGRVKRVATWKWEEDEWKVLVKKEGSGSSRVERPLPTPKEDAPTGSRLLKAAGMMKDPSSNSEHKEDHGVQEENDGEEISTDNDGWIYSDNKWDGRSSKGGMGKYTRYRRWTRIAILIETSELVGPGDIGIYREEQPDLTSSPASDVPGTIAHDRRSSSIDSENSERTGIRQRLKAAITAL